MEERILKTLEFEKIQNMLEAHAISRGAKELIKDLKPLTDYQAIIKEIKHTSDAVNLSLNQGRLSLRGFKDIRRPLKRLEISANLSIAELLYIGDFLLAVGSAISYYNEGYDMISQSSLNDFFTSLNDLAPIEKDLHRCIISEEELADDASRELFKIRQAMKNTQNEIKDKLNKMTQSPNMQTYLQESIVTIRNDRYCLPVKVQYKPNVPGIIHDQSSTGSTIFVEPIEIVNINNKFNQLVIEEKKEILKIIKRLSNLCNQHLYELSINYDMLTKLDFIFAKSDLSLELRCTEPIFNEDFKIHLNKARHPLIDPDQVVPSTIYLGHEFSTLVITGPNTGGKTVSLKTLGLLSLMGQAGLHIPAADNSQLAVFENIFADIGDEQSIEQSLSTFSSHMTNIIDILKKADHRSLVLFDELGAGTDPTEGAALAMAILDYLKNKSVLTVATTHYSELKVYAMSTSNVENASCEFDVNTLRPTYKLLIGVPGKSNAFAISKRLGLSDAIINSAKDLLSARELRFEDLVTDLETSKKAVLQEGEKLKRLKKEIDRLNEDIATRQDTIQSQKEKILSKARQEAYEMLDKAKNEADSIIRNMNKLVKTGHALPMAELEKGRTSLRESMDSLGKHKKTKKLPKGSSLTPDDIKLGMEVYVKTFSQNGIVQSLVNQRNELEVQMGIMKAYVSLSDLARLGDHSKTSKDGPNKTSSPTINYRQNKSMSIKNEIDLRGLTGLEAIEKLDKYLDDVYLSNLDTVTIIHGKGTGALRKQIHNYLRSLPHIDSYRLGQHGEGEHGVTIVKIK